VVVEQRGGIVGIAEKGIDRAVVEIHRTTPNAPATVSVTPPR
jgi:hypothetical protein